MTKIAADATENKTFYAKWTANSYKITFDYQNATGNNATKEKSVTYDKTYGTLPAPTKTGYTFQGWYTQTGGKGSKILAATTVKITAAQTLYAHWLDQTPPDAPKLQSGVTLPADWTNTQKTIPLTLYDGVGVTELWVKTDSGADYVINGTESITADENGCIPIQPEWIGETLEIVKKGNNVETSDSAAQSVPLPARPTSVPDAPEKSGCTESAITLMEAADAGVEYHISGSTAMSDAWQEETEFTRLTEKTIYTFTARYAATDMSFASAPSNGTDCNHA